MLLVVTVMLCVLSATYFSVIPSATFTPSKCPKLPRVMVFPPCEVEDVEVMMLPVCDLRDKKSQEVQSKVLSIATATNNTFRFMSEIIGVDK